MKTFSICFVALFAVAYAKSVIDDVDFVNGTNGFDDRIIGGKKTTIDKYPYQISLRRGGGPHLCGGAIISPVRALSAAHCLPRDDPPHRYHILAGSTTHRGDPTAQVRELSRFVAHGRYNKPYFANDIALLFWNDPLTISANVRPIRIPTSNAEVPYEEDATMTGWGPSTPGSSQFSNILEVITLPLVSTEDCNRPFDLGYGGDIKPDMVCAGEYAKPSDKVSTQRNIADEYPYAVCPGDSGNPLVHDNLLIGITSWGRRACAPKAFPFVFARVAFFNDWINDNLNNEN